MKKFIIVGNPNVGKSVVFGRLANQYVTVSNYPGTTVSVMNGWMNLSSGPIPLIDTPGVNNLFPNSEEEMVTRNIIFNADPCDHIVQVLDTKNLKRGLFLSIQLSEIGSCGLMALNMWDEAKLRGYEIDIKALEEIFGVRCFPTVAIHNKGINALKQMECRHFYYTIVYHPIIESAIEELKTSLPAMNILPRALALMILSGEATFLELLKDKIPPDVLQKVVDVRDKTERAINADLRTVINKTRMAEAQRIEKKVLKQKEPPKVRKLWSFLERLSTHPWGGYILLSGILYLLYQFVGVLGAGTLVDLVENRLFNQILNPSIINGFDHFLSFPHTHEISEGAVQTSYILEQQSLSFSGQIFRFMHDFFVGDYGAITMALTYGFAIIFPVVLTFFMAFGLLEDLGYLPRLSVLLNRFFKKIGLNGKAVLPMVLGLGCDTMATVTSRILDTKKERVIVTFLLALAVPCSAQLGVIMFLLVGGVGAKGVFIWSTVVMMVLYIAGFGASKLIEGETSPLILEIPPLRWPSLRNIFLKTLARVEWYLKEVIPIFLLGTAILFILHELKLLIMIQNALKPLVVGWLQLPAQGAEAILMGFFRRDYGAAGFIRMFEQGIMTPAQILVGVTTITLFVPCIANALVIVKERGAKTASLMILTVFIIAFVVGGLLSRILTWIPL